VSGHGGGWQEVGERVFRFRYRSLDLNVGAVLGDGEVLVVDTRSGPAEAGELLADLRALTRLPCRQAVNTHAHFDHCFGTQSRICGEGCRLGVWLVIRVAWCGDGWWRAAA
jgi:glyoxylase-like metal-dependent hydrolase (beta-lactamase superfamily II)